MVIKINKIIIILLIIITLVVSFNLFISCSTDSKIDDATTTSSSTINLTTTSISTTNSISSTTSTNNSLSSSTTLSSTSNSNSSSTSMSLSTTILTSTSTSFPTTNSSTTTTIISSTTTTTLKAYFGIYIGDRSINWGNVINSPVDDGFTLLKGVEITEMTSDITLITDVTPANKYIGFYVKNKIAMIDTIQYLDSNNNVLGYINNSSSIGENSGSWASNINDLWFDSSYQIRLSTVDSKYLTMGLPTWYSCYGKTYNSASSFSKIKVVLLSEKFTTPPSEVDKLKTEIGFSQVTLSWIPPYDTDFSKVEIICNPGNLSYEIPKGTNSKIITGLNNETQYTFTIKTVDDAGNKSEGLTKQATPSGELSNLQIANGNGIVTLYWKDPINYLDFSKVEISYDGFIVDVLKGKCSKIIRNLTNNTQYNFILKTVDNSSNKSNGVSIQGTPSSSSLSSIFGLYIGDHQVNFGPNVNSPADDGFTLLDSIDISDMSCDKSIIVNFTPENKYLAVFTKNKIVK